MKNFTKKLNKKTVVIGLAAATLLAFGGGVISQYNNSNQETAPASANHQGTKVWLQYGTLKYALKGPSGRVYPAGTRVVRELNGDDMPAKSLPGRSFELTWQIGGKPGLQRLQDTGGGDIAEAYVNYEDWQEIDYPSTNVVLVNNTTDYTDLKSSDFHPVDSSNPDVAHADTSKLNGAFVKFTMTVNFQKLSSSESKYVDDLQNRFTYAKDMGATQESVDALTQEINDAIARYKATGHLTNSNGATNNSSDVTPNSDTGSGTTGSTSTNVTSPHTVRLRKASYRYTSKGKRVSKKLLKKGSYVKINGKTYYIKGKTYYRIAKNRYIRKVNVAK